ncbi:MAG: c-type cytochrome [Gammaproteobacteria bacterium]|nr:c-type cytochrome [Gammaproteobacteria bacterium]
MKKVAISVSALFLALGVLSGCGEKKEEAPKVEAPAATEAKPAEQAAAPAQEAAPAAPAEQAAAPAQEAAPAAPAEQAAAPAQEAAPAAPAEQAAATTPDGEKVYRGLCFSCHDMGIANAPKLGDKAAWDPRIATGMDALYETSTKGNPAKPAMPAKGGNPALSDEEVKAAVDWMVSQAK